MKHPEKLVNLVACGQATEEQMNELGSSVVANIKSSRDTLQVRSRGSDIITKNDEKRQISYLVSDETPDRVGDIIKVKGWDLVQYRKNPVILWAHDGSSVPPIGRSTNIRRRYTPEARLTADIEFAPKEAYEFADTIYQLASRGFIKATSVGFMPLETMDLAKKAREEMGLGRYGQVFTKAELMEISIVSVPANPSALELGMKQLINEGVFDKGLATKFFDVYPKDQEAVEKKIRASCRSFVDMGAAWDLHALQERMAKAPHDTPKAPVDQDWDAAAVWKGIAENYEGEEKAAKYWEVVAYMVPDADPETRTAYKFPHQDVDGKVVWHGVAAAMAALNGARGGAKGLSEKDRKGVYRHLVAHYKQFEEEAPELRSIDPDAYNEQDPLELAMPEALEPELEQKSPACRMDGESEQECVSRKTAEMIEEGMDQDQASAAAYSMCETACSEKEEAAPVKKDVEKLEEAFDLLVGAAELVKSAIDEYGGNPDDGDYDDDEEMELLAPISEVKRAETLAMALLIEQQAEQTKATRQLVDSLTDLTRSIHRDLHDGLSCGGSVHEPDAARPDVVENDEGEIARILESTTFRGFAERVRRDISNNNNNLTR